MPKNDSPAASAPATVAAAPKAKPKFAVGELAANAKKLFGVQPEVVTCALRAASITTACTKDEATAAIKSFLEREVK